MTLLRPNLSLSNPASGKIRQALRPRAEEFTAKALGTGFSIKSLIYTGIHTNIR